MRLSVAMLRWVVTRDLPIEFVPQELTSYGGLELLRRYLQRVDLPRRLRRALGALGSDYGSARVSLLVLALLYVGGRRPEDLRYVAGDPLVRRFCGLARVPTARTVGVSALDGESRPLNGRPDVSGVDPRLTRWTDCPLIEKPTGVHRVGDVE